MIFLIMLHNKGINNKINKCIISGYYFNTSHFREKSHNVAIIKRLNHFRFKKPKNESNGF